MKASTYKHLKVAGDVTIPHKTVLICVPEAQHPNFEVRADESEIFGVY